MANIAEKGMYSYAWSKYIVHLVMLKHARATEIIMDEFRINQAEFVHFLQYKSACWQVMKDLVHYTEQWLIKCQESTIRRGLADVLAIHLYSKRDTKVVEFVLDDLLELLTAARESARLNSRGFRGYKGEAKPPTHTKVVGVRPKEARIK